MKLGLLPLSLPLLLAVADCRPKAPTAETIEAGVAVVDPLCKFLEGVTDTGAVITICAAVEEIALIVSTVTPFLAGTPKADGGACVVIPTTAVCATRAEIGRGILRVLEVRRARLSVDGGQAR